MSKEKPMTYRTTAAAVALGLPLVLGGCQSNGPLPSMEAELTPAQRVYAMQSELDGLLEQVEMYADQPECSETVVVACYDPDVVETLTEAGEEADTALDQAEVIVRSPGGDDEIVVYTSIARTALNRIITELATPEASQ